MKFISNLSKKSIAEGIIASFVFYIAVFAIGYINFEWFREYFLQIAILALTFFIVNTEKHFPFCPKKDYILRYGKTA